MAPLHDGGARAWEPAGKPGSMNVEESTSLQLRPDVSTLTPAGGLSGPVPVKLGVPP